MLSLACCAPRQSAALRQNCGNAIPLAPLAGSLRHVPLPNDCTSDRLNLSLAPGSVEKGPLFACWSGTCCGIESMTGWTIATALNGGETRVLANLPGRFPGRQVTAAPDGSLWAAADKGYLHVFRTKKISNVAAINEGYKAASVGVGGNGVTYGLEERSDPKGGNSTRLVDVPARATIASLRGWTEDLDQGNDHHLYFKTFNTEREPWRCTIYEVMRNIVRVRSSCSWSNGKVAVDSSGSIWQPEILGVSRTARNGSTLHVGPVEPFPCTINNTAILTPRELTVSRDDSVWFLLRHPYRAANGGIFETMRLYHVDKRGRLSTIDVPGAGKMVAMSDGTLWLVGVNELLQFVPANK